MKHIKLLYALIFLLGIGISISAAAHHGHFHHHGPRIGFVIGGPLWWPGPQYYTPYYYPYVPIVTVPAQPPVYIEQSQASVSSSSAYWYYCDNPQAYYPYIKQCASGWQRVAPIPPSQ